MEAGDTVSSDEQRDHARQWLLTRAGVAADTEGDAGGNQTALTDLGLVNPIVHRAHTGGDNAEEGADTDADTGVADMVAALTLLRHLRDELTRWEPQLIAAARAAGASWVQLAPALGVASRQAAERRYLRLRPDDTGLTHTGEQRVQAERDRRAGDRAVSGWARQNAATLRTLAAQVSALATDPDLTADGHHHLDDVTAALGENDTTALLRPLGDIAAHLQTSHPALADKITAVTDQSDRARRGARP
ncbi:MAG TPA: HSP18 transcriptional regulator [Pseudonocardiaceae bacterium]